MVRRSFWALSLIVILALAGMGVAYGLWYENLFITGSVTTGVVDVEITAEAFDVEDKDVGTCVIVDELLDDNLIDIVVDNAYPSYECWVNVAVANVGTVPVHLTPLEWWEEGLGGAPTFDLVDFDEECFDEIQIHPGEEETCQLMIHFDNEDGLEQGETYYFAYQFMAHQYNEDPDPPNGSGALDQ